MPRYDYACADHGEFERRFGMGEAPATVLCPRCLLAAPRVFGAFQYTEDRRHHGGERRSAATGMRAAQSRTEERAIERAMGIEFMGNSEAPAHLRNAAAYSAHLKSGGERLPNKVVAELVSPPKEKAPTVLEALRKAAPRLGEIPSDRPIRGKKLPAFPKDVTI
jgi:putative FmdB family regulatory protein